MCYTYLKLNEGLIFTTLYQVIFININLGCILQYKVEIAFSAESLVKTMENQQYSLNSR
jgi:hypothetical protein